MSRRHQLPLLAFVVAVACADKSPAPVLAIEVVRTNRADMGDRSRSDGTERADHRPMERPPAPALPPLGENVQRGVEWLVAHQLPSGGWGQGDESVAMRQSQQGELRDTPNVADTSMALLALLRAGHTPTSGRHREVVRRGVEYVLSEIEASDDQSLFVTGVRGTRVQSKIGTYVDTFASLIVLTELKGHMGGSVANRRIDRAREKVIAKMERNQGEDGGWANAGWAPALSDALAARGLNRAAQGGDDVDEVILRRTEERAQRQFDGATGRVAADGSAGVGLYARAANTASQSESANTRRLRRRGLQTQAESGATPAERRAARQALRQGAEVEQSAESAQRALVERLDDDAFIRGFGNNGGEEFLSYMLVSDSIRARGDDEWREWNTGMTRLLGGVQNEDGSWSGHHCITGRTFCTATALLVLMADRAPMALAERLRGA